MWGDSKEESWINENAPIIRYRTDLKERKVSPEIIKKLSTEKKKAYLSGDIGAGGCANGPVDNPNENCVSCHGRNPDTDYSLQIDTILKNLKEIPK
jgi:intein/homing endonuclease